MSGLLLLTLICIVVSELRVGSRNRQLAWANQQIENQTIQDNLTKLPNRLYLAEYANKLFSDQPQQHEIAFYTLIWTVLRRSMMCWPSGR